MTLTEALQSPRPTPSHHRKEQPMPEYIVELAFEYRSSYRVVAETITEAIDAAEAHDQAHYLGALLPERVAAANVTLLEEREFTDYLDPRIFDADGKEIILN
jgi:hypothetical protein